MRELIIGKNDAGQRLDRFVSKAVPLLPDALLQKYIRIKRIKLNGRSAKRDARLSEGNAVQLYINDEFFEKPSEANAYLRITAPRLDIVFEDENIMLINKPQGQLCHPADGGSSTDTLVAHVQAHAYLNHEWRPGTENSFAPALCNRIDRNTGGIVIAAKNAEALRIINEKIKSREVDKYYLAAVFGDMKPESGELRGHLFKDAKKNQVYVKSTPSVGTREAVLQYRTLARKGGLSLLECRLITGRTHQIRAQLAAAGHPILGDGKYGSERENKRFNETRQCLWSYRAAFDFETDAGALNYLRGSEFMVQKIPFAEKHFNFENSH